MKRLIEYAKRYNEHLRWAVFIAGVALFFFNQFQWSAVLFLWGWSFLPRETHLKPNQALITAPVEPSADIRQWASVVTQMRTALLADNAPEDADRILTDFLRSIQRGETS